MWVAALMVEYRDVRFIVPFIVQFGLYVSPVHFPFKIDSGEIPAPLRAEPDGWYH